MKNRTLLDTKINLTTLEEAEVAIEANGQLVADLYAKERSGCSLRTAFLMILIPINIGMYFLLKNVSPGYVVPKMILGNIVAIILVFITIILIVNIRLRRKMKKEDEEMEGDEYVNFTEKDYRISRNPRLVLREHDFTCGEARYEWTKVIGYTNTDEWLFVLKKDKSIVPIKIDNFKEKRRMEILGIFSDRIRKAKTSDEKIEE